MLVEILQDFGVQQSQLLCPFLRQIFKKLPHGFVMYCVLPHFHGSSVQIKHMLASVCRQIRFTVRQPGLCILGVVRIQLRHFVVSFASDIVLSGCSLLLEAKFIYAAESVDLAVVIVSY